jgi:hypothetical protein
MNLKRLINRNGLSRKVSDGRISDVSISQKKKNRKSAIQAIGGENAKNIKTFAILTAQNPNSQSATSSFNKKANKSLISLVKAAGYVTIPVKGHFSGNDENSFLIVNIPFDVARKYAGQYNQTSFCYGENGVTEYWEKEDENEPYDSVTNDYIKKDEVKGYDRLDANAENYTLIGKKFKFTFPFSIFDSVSSKIQDSIDLYFNGDDRIVDWCIDHVGLPVHLRMKKLYQFC